MKTIEQFDDTVTRFLKSIRNTEENFFFFDESIYLADSLMKEGWTKKKIFRRIEKLREKIS